MFIAEISYLSDKIRSLICVSFTLQVIEIFNPEHQEAEITERTTHF